jgi:hypothetical protein
MITQTTLSGNIPAESPHAESIWTRATQNVLAVMQEIRSQFVVRPNFDRLRQTLQCLPLSCEELAWLRTKSHNAEACHIRGEATGSTRELGVILRHLYRENDECQ